MQNKPVDTGRIQPYSWLKRHKNRVKQPQNAYCFVSSSRCDLCGRRRCRNRIGRVARKSAGLRRSCGRIAFRQQGSCTKNQPADFQRSDLPPAPDRKQQQRSHHRRRRDGSSGPPGRAEWSLGFTKKARTSFIWCSYYRKANAKALTVFMSTAKKSTSSSRHCIRGIDLSYRPVIRKRSPRQTGNLVLRRRSIGGAGKSGGGRLDLLDCGAARADPQLCARQTNAAELRAEHQRGRLRKPFLDRHPGAAIRRFRHQNHMAGTGDRSAYAICGRNPLLVRNFTARQTGIGHQCRKRPDRSYPMRRYDRERRRPRSAL